MNILIINSSTLPFPPAKGGAVEYLIDMFLKENEKKKQYNVTICTILDKESKDMEKEYNMCKFIHINKNFIFHLKNIFKVAKRKLEKRYCANEYLSEVIKNIKNNIENYDLIIVENVPQFGLELRKLNPKKLVLHMHNDNLNKQTEQANEIKKAYDEIWCLSNYVMNKVIEIDNDNSNVKLLYNGIDVKKYLSISSEENTISDYKKRYKISNDDIVVMYSGRLVEEKGILQLLKAFNNCKIKNLKLIIVGSSSYGKGKNTKFVKKLNDLANNNEDIIFTGYINYEDMPYIYKICDFGIVPSICEEGFALTVVEFLASGKPVIVTNSGAIPELVDSNSAIMIKKEKNVERELEEAIKEMLSKLKSYDSEYNKNIAKKYSIEKYCKRFEELVGVIIDENK